MYLHVGVSIVFGFITEYVTIVMINLRAQGTTTALPEATITRFGLFRKGDSRSKKKKKRQAQIRAPSAGTAAILAASGGAGRRSRKVLCTANVLHFKGSASPPGGSASRTANVLQFKGILEALQT